MRFLAAAMARRAKEAIRRASARSAFGILELIALGKHA